MNFVLNNNPMTDSEKDSEALANFLKLNPFNWLALINCIFIVGEGESLVETP